MIEIIIATLAVYGVATIVAEYGGPYDFLLKIRSKFIVASCVMCLSVWLAIPIAYFTGLNFFEYLAIVGGVLVLDRWNL